jgi:ABC-type Fe3+-hydroxamate transport system substrate-binding protein
VSGRAGTVGLLALLSACGGEQRAATRVDHAGHPVEIDVPATRIVSLSPSLTELLFAIGAGDRMVGRTRWGTLPHAAEDVPSVGDGLSPNLETILAREPDVVVLYHTPTNAATVDRLRAMGVATLSVRMDRLEDVPEAARFLAEALGDLPAADTLADRFDARFDSLRRRANRPASGSSVAILAWDAPPVVIGGGSYLSQLLELTGARNVFADLDAPSATVSLESIALRDPDVLLFAGGGEPAVLDRAEWRALSAVEEGRILTVDGDSYGWPSLRSLDLVEELANAVRRARS